MRRILLLCTLASLLPACALIDKAQTPDERYFVLNGAVTQIAAEAERWVDVCKSFPKGDACYKKFPAIQAGAVSVKEAMKQADKVFITHNSEYYDLSLTAVENAILALRKILYNEVPNVE